MKTAAELNASAHAWVNSWKILRSIDRADLYDAGVRLSNIQWASFRRDPGEFMVHLTDAWRAAIWSIVERRSQP